MLTVTQKNQYLELRNLFSGVREIGIFSSIQWSAPFSYVAAMVQ